MFYYIFQHFIENVHILTNNSALSLSSSMEAGDICWDCPPRPFCTSSSCLVNSSTLATATVSSFSFSLKSARIDSKSEAKKIYVNLVTNTAYTRNVFYILFMVVSNFFPLVFSISYFRKDTIHKSVIFIRAMKLLKNRHLFQCAINFRSAKSQSNFNLKSVKTILLRKHFSGKWWDHPIWIRVWYAL